MRILELTYHHGHELERVFFDAGTPPHDRLAIDRALRDLDMSRNPRDELWPTPASPLLLEFVVHASSSGHRYGFVFVDQGHVADAIAYWREPPLFTDPATSHPHGMSRMHALNVALERLRRRR
jgi:hypothetical protein